MGDQADMMVDGMMCQGCGQLVDGDAPGFPRYCNDCQPDADVGQQDKADRRGDALRDFRAARTLAHCNNLCLDHHTDAHYQLMPRDRHWLLNIYPGNCRLYYDRNKAKPPYLRIDSPWTLTEVVQAMVHELERKS